MHEAGGSHTLCSSVSRGKIMTLCNSFECSCCIVQGVAKNQHSFRLALYHPFVTPTTVVSTVRPLKVMKIIKPWWEFQKSLLQSFYGFFSIHDLIRDLTENFQKCSVDLLPPVLKSLAAKHRAADGAACEAQRSSSITTSGRHHASTATHHLLINSLHSQCPPSQFIFL